MGDIIVKINPVVQKTVVLEQSQSKSVQVQQDVQKTFVLEPVTTKVVKVAQGCGSQSIDVSQFITTAETGSFLSQFYPYNSNPSGYVTAISSSSFEFQTTLPNSVDFYDVNYPFILSGVPGAIVCEIENNIDVYLYSHAINSVNTTGFRIFFSDILSASGYVLHTIVNR